MPANGAAALQLVAPEPAPPATDSRALQQAIGQAMARAAATISKGVFEWATDGLSSATRAAGGEMVFRVYALRESLPAGVDFDTVARAEGRRVMQEIHGEVFRQH